MFRLFQIFVVSTFALLILGLANTKDDVVCSSFTECQTLALENNSIAQFTLGNLYLKGISVQKDYKLALYWLLKSAHSGSPLAQFDVGYIYDRGLGVTKNENKAVEWYERSAQNGNPKAQWKLAIKLLKVNYSDGQTNMAEIWLAKSCVNGFSPAFEAMCAIKQKTDIVDAYAWCKLAQSKGGKIPENMVMDIEKSLLSYQ